MTKAFAKIRFAEYSESAVAETLRACGGDIGGGSETLILDTLVFDGGQITSPSVRLHPKWGGSLHKPFCVAGRANDGGYQGDGR